MDNRARAAMIRKVERKIKAKYRKRCGWCFLIALIIGLVLGFIACKQWFPTRVEVPTPVTATNPPLAADANGGEDEPGAVAEPVATPVVTLPPATATPTPTPVPTPTPIPMNEYFGLSSEEVGIQPTATPTPTPVPTAVATPTPETGDANQLLAQVIDQIGTQDAVPSAAPTATQANVLLTVTPSPDDQAISTLPTQGEQTQPAAQDANAKGSKGNPYLLDEVFTFETEVLPNGSPRTNVADATYDTAQISISLNNYLTPEYFASRYSDKYKLTGTEAGAEITFSVDSFTGATAIMPQNAIDIAFENEAGAQNDGYQIMDAEISGLYDITVEAGQTVQVYKRFAYDAAENTQYMVVSYYQGGQEHTVYFKLDTAEPEIVYDRITSGSRGDNVKALQERLIELGYLDDGADGIFGSKTGNAIRDAQAQAGMTENGVADNEFQQYIFSDEAQPAS